jgi:hypothetical protein
MSDQRAVYHVLHISWFTNPHVRAAFDEVLATWECPAGISALLKEDFQIIADNRSRENDVKRLVSEIVAPASQKLTQNADFLRSMIPSVSAEIARQMARDPERAAHMAELNRRLVLEMWLEA